MNYYVVYGLSADESRKQVGCKPCALFNNKETAMQFVHTRINQLVENHAKMFESFCKMQEFDKNYLAEVCDMSYRDPDESEVLYVISYGKKDSVKTFGYRLDRMELNS